MNDNRDIMNNDRMKNKMEEEMKLRLESDSWNFTIARKVMETRNSKSEKTINIWSKASLATAAVSFLIFMAGVYSSAFYNSSHTGTGSIYSYAYIKNDNNLDNDIIAAKLELTINEAYPMR